MMVLMLVVDSLRADAPGFAGGEAATRAMDELATEGTRFPHLTVSGSWTIPSLTSMTTGVFPHRVGIVRWRHPWPRYQPSLMSAFGAAGFEVHVLGHNPRWIFGSCPQRGQVGDSQEVEEVIAALSRPRGSDRFVLLHHWWTHLPYVNRKLPASGWKKACELSLESLNRNPDVMAPKFRSNYFRTIEYFSRELLGRYLDAASAGGDDVLLVLTGDHGENWGEALPPGRRIEHIFDLHGRWLRDTTTQVPLLLWGKGPGGSVPAGQLLSGSVRGVDLAPTIAHMAGIPWPGALPADDGPTVVDRGILPDGQGLLQDGRSFADAVAASESLPEETVLTVASHNTHEPDTYPADGQEAWRTMGLRTDRAWMVWDGVNRSRDVVVEGPIDGDLEIDEALWEWLIDEWRGAVAPGPGLPPDLYPRTRPEEPAAEPSVRRAHSGRRPRPGDEQEILRKMRMLGYMD